MPARHPKPIHIQVAEELKRQIQSGDLPVGAKLPSVRALSQQKRISYPVAQRVIHYLDTEGLVTTSPQGTFAAPGRVLYGPQQRSRGVTFPASQRVEIRFAEEVEAPAYIRPILGPDPDGGPGEPLRVIRREWVSYDWQDGGEVPFMLSVSWCPRWARVQAPELLAAFPLPGMGSAAELIAARTRREITGSHDAHEARPIKDDGREGPLLRLPKDTVILGEVYQWWSGEQTLEYLEFITLQRIVIESDTEL